MKQTSEGYLLFYTLGSGPGNLFEQIDPDNLKLKRESDELFQKEPIPKISLALVCKLLNYKSFSCKCSLKLIFHAE